MKFGKQLQSNQIPGWSAAYLDYKFLKKIINSLEKGRLGDAALFATGVRPEYIPDDGHVAAQILPRPDAPDELQAHKAAFFFKLERELEKINAFYLQKEAELKTRLKTLVDKRKLLMAKRGSSKISKESPAFYALYEGFRYFEKDLSKLQQFIEINATGFRKILKKWDKRSKSQTKELYLARQVEVQPCFNREFIAELSDIAAANLLELENLSEQRPNPTINGDVSVTADGASALSPEKRLDFAAARSQDVDLLADLEDNLSLALKQARTAAAADMIRAAQQNEDQASVSRVVWRALLHSPQSAIEAAMKAGIPDFGFVDDINSRSCLHEAALAGNLQLVTAALDHGIDAGQRDIYGRAAISYAAMNGHADVCTLLLTQPGVDAATADLDGFSPLVLAVINGRSDVVRILLAHGVSVDAKVATDLIPLCLAAQGGHADITAMLLQRGATIMSNPEGLTPQALAAREGHTDCLRLLMQAKANPDAPEKGTLWTPLFFAAESGHVDCIQVLLESKCKLEAVDEKGRNATFYAAWKGHIDCLLVLLQAAKARPAPEQARDVAMTSADGASTEAAATRRPRKKSRSEEKDAAGAAASLDDLDLELEADGIPSLSLPPPIIPFRTYGHNYLDKRSLVTISLSNSSVKLYKHHDSLGLDQFSTSSVKLVMTSRPDASSTSYIPHNIVLPLADEREVFSFQVEAVDRLSIEWELKPTFGSKVIGKAVALQSSFEGMTDRKRFVLPLQDAYLKVVGEVSFEIDFVKPFDGVQLEIGGRVETYWKSLLPGTVITSGGLRMTPTGAVGEPSSSFVSPNATAPITAGEGTASGVPSTGSNAPTATAVASSTAASVSSVGGSLGNTSALVPSAGSASVVTASSLTGEYLRLTVQVTKDGVAVVYPSYRLPLPDFDVYVGSVTSAEFLDFAKKSNRLLDTSIDKAKAESMTLQDWTVELGGRSNSVNAAKMSTLDSLLSLLPVSIGIDVDVLYPSSADVRNNPSLPKTEVNSFVDAVLHAVYRASTSNRQQSRKILFTSRSPTVCTALNWKQPNYAVFFESDCGLETGATMSSPAVPTATASTSTSSAPSSSSAAAAAAAPLLAPRQRKEPDPRRSSLCEAVRFAKDNNLLGLAIDAPLLNSVPELVQTIKAAGFLLITVGEFTAAPTTQAVVGGEDAADGAGAGASRQGSQAAPPTATVDGVISGGLLVCQSSKVTDAAFW